MLDKDFDELFKSSFEDYEVYPHAESWDKINKRINKKAPHKKFPAFWLVAASVVLVLGLSIQLYTKPGAVIKLRADSKKEIMEDLAAGQKATPQDNEDIDVITAPHPMKKNAVRKGIYINPNPVKGTVSTGVPINENLESSESMQIVENVRPVKPKLIAYESLKDEQIPASQLSNGNIINLKSERPLSLPASKKLTIASVGELVNRVVAAVDKRDEKIIKLSRTAESENEITGINLGVFRFSKEE